jgi:hypothetical protein
MGNSVLGAEYAHRKRIRYKSFELYKTPTILRHDADKDYNELKDLNGNITGMVTAYIRTGGNPTAEDLGFAWNITGDAQILGKL